MNLNLYFVLLLAHTFFAELLRIFFLSQGKIDAKFWRTRYGIFGILYLIPYLLRVELGYVINLWIALGFSVCAIFFLGMFAGARKYWQLSAGALAIDGVLTIICFDAARVSVILLFGLSVQLVVCFMMRHISRYS